VKGIREGGRAVDVLFHEGCARRFEGPWVDTRSTHGTGCTFSAAITACLALGHPLEEAVARAKAYLGRALTGAPGLGGGIGPVDHHAAVI
jgi:hydroxymethylpyrimidine/phosphomethylpyrimidine kinase